MNERYKIPEDLSIPWFLDCKNPEVIAERKHAWENYKPQPIKIEKECDEATKALIEKFAREQKERKERKRVGSLAKSATKNQDREQASSGARWDPQKCKWVNDEIRPKESITMAKSATKKIEDEPTPTVNPTAKKIEDEPTPTINPIAVPAEGQELVSTFDSNVKCHRIPGSKKVIFRGQEMTISKAALTVAHETGRHWGSIRGPAYWTLNGVRLIDLKDEK